MFRFLLHPMLANIAILSIMLLLCPACEDSDGTDSGDRVGSCVMHSDCLDGERCVFNTCLETCEETSDCAHGNRCHAMQVCTDCVDNTDCEEGKYCFAGSCRLTPNTEPEELNSCLNADDCNNGQACVDKLCQRLCQDEADCRYPRHRCSSDHLCVFCLVDSDCAEDQRCQAGACVDDPGNDGDEDGDSSIEPVQCDPACIAEDGQFCDAESEECKDITCTPCDADSDCGGNAICMADKQAGGGRICMAAENDCPAGFTARNDGYCHPDARCPEMTYAALAEPCGFSAETDLPPCGRNLRCLYNSSISFCSQICEAFGDCAESFPGGCCQGIGGDEMYCLTPNFCSR